MTSEITKTRRRVAIVGAGISGLVSTKYALENDLEPVTFERTDQIGGLWKANDTTAIWSGMRTNVTKYVSTLSDLAWPPGTNVYPDTRQVLAYFHEYVNKFGLDKHVRLNHSVESVVHVRRDDDDDHHDGSWQVRYRNLLSDEVTCELFDFLIIASGIYGKTKMPQDKNVHKFKGIIQHSSQFKINDPALKSKNILVVGGLVSGVDLASHLIDHAHSVIHMFRRTPVIVPMLVKKKLDSSSYSIMPGEFFTNTRLENYATLSPEEFKARRFKFLEELLPYQSANNSKSNCPEALRFDFRNLDQEMTTAPSDIYIDVVRDGKIEPIRSSIDRFTEHGVYLTNGRYVNVDVVLYCTGFRPAIEYLDPSIVKAMKFREDMPKFSFLLYKNTFVPGWATMAFVGQYARVYFTGYEMQAMWATSVFAGRVKLPEKSIMDTYVNRLEEKRARDKGAQFPYGSYVGALDGFAQEIGIMPDLDAIKTTQPDIYDYLWNDEVMWSHYLLFDKNRSDKEREYFLNMLKEVRDYKSHIYRIDKNEEDIRQSDVQDLFAKFYKF